MPGLCKTGLFKAHRICLAGTVAFYALASLPGCAGVEARTDKAVAIAGQSGLAMQAMRAGPFTMTAFARISQPGGPATFYIEGDGLAWIDRQTPSGDPTPKHPVGLELAAADKGANVIYLARPCQYSRMADGGVCPQRYWTEARLAPEVIDALNVEIDAIKARYRLGALRLTGFSGGGGAAVLLAARRRDVVALRTVAGNIDQNAFTSLHRLSPLSGSMEPRDAARAVAAIPQIHFVGRDDKVIPPAIAQSFQAAAGSPACMKIQIVDGARHDDSWAALWPALLVEPLPCAAAH